MKSQVKLMEDNLELISVEEHEADKRSSGEQVRQRLYDLMREPSSVRRKMEGVLELGIHYLGVNHGYITRIDEETDEWETIVSTDPPDGEFPEGLKADLTTTYCRRTIKGRQVALHDAPNQGWEDDIAYETYGLKCYHGVVIPVNGDAYGTLCFASEEKRARSFDEPEMITVELMGQLLGQAIERHQYTTEITNRDRLISVLNRVLRHNLRNDMNVISGYAEILRQSLDGEAAAKAQNIGEAADKLLDISEKARRLENNVRDPPIPRRMDLIPLVREAKAEVGEDHPEATINLKAPEEAIVYTSPRAKTVVRELLENSAKHAGDKPTIEAVINAGDDKTVLRIADDGPGLPKQEREVLRSGSETPLEHGSGLGLFLVYWLVMMLEAEIETEVNDGTTITLRFPRSPTNRHLND
ncbi:MAG: ATP-binding protein [Halobacteria archaeon]|nr:ATP-binding protein [Halobacteria archaeon]